MVVEEGETGLYQEAAVVNYERHDWLGEWTRSAPLHHALSCAI